MNCQHSFNPAHEHGPCLRCGEPRYYMDMGFFSHCDDHSDAEAFCGRPTAPASRKRWWKR